MSPGTVTAFRHSICVDKVLLPIDISLGFELFLLRIRCSRHTQQGHLKTHFPFIRLLDTTLTHTLLLLREEFDLPLVSPSSQRSLRGESLAFNLKATEAPWLSCFLSGSVFRNDDISSFQ